MTVAYDGGGFHGFQVQPGTRTVQGSLEEVLSRITNAPVRIHAAGRTDTGVHALGQVVNFKTQSRIAPERLLKGVNALLPKDISVASVQDVPAHFHARFSAVSRVYVYVIDTEPIRSPFRVGHAVHIPYPIDPEKMFRAAETLIGERDFSSFRAASDSNRHAMRCMIQSGGWIEGQRVYLYFNANAFLHHMVRNIVGTLLWVGRGKLNIDEFCTITEAKDRRLAGPTAPPHGLFLMKVIYPASAERY